MNTDMTWQTSSDNLSETDQLAKKLASNICGGEVIEFKSDLGGGKTTFISSLVAALGSEDHVSSPTFTVSKEYKTKKFRILHFDFYRLTDPGLVANYLEEAVLNSDTLCLVEWGNSVDSVLAKDRLVVTINKDPIKEMSRHFVFNYSETTKYLVSGLN